MGTSQRNKGARGERELARLLEDQLGLKVARNLMQWRDGGPDLIGLPVALEVKRCEQIRLKDWWGQAVDQAEKASKTPCLAWRQNGKPWAFRVPLSFINSSFPASMTADVDLLAFCELIRNSLF